MEETHITSNPRSGKLGTLNEDEEDDEEEEEEDDDEEEEEGLISC